jgi:hypothetical protein
VIAAIEQIPPDIPLITNEPSAIALLTGRTPYQIPLTILEGEGTAFGEGDTNAEVAFRDRAGALVLFNSIDDELARIHGARAPVRRQDLTAGLHTALAAPDGMIYFNPPADPR